MIPDGIELFQLRQRRSPDGDTYFTGKLGSAAIVVIRDDFERDLWKVIAGDPFQARDNRARSTARAIAAAPADEGDDEGNYDEGDMDDDVSDDLIAAHQPREAP